MGNLQTWKGQSGTDYTYYVYDIGVTLKASAGNYIFCKITEDGKWRPIYIGQTTDLSERFDNHHKMPSIQREGATHIHAHLNASQGRRLAEERDLVRRYDPVCNG